MPWTKEQRTDKFIRIVGIAELLGALGVVLPMLTHSLPWLTPLAAIGLSILQGFAIFTENLPKKDYKFPAAQSLLYGYIDLCPNRMQVVVYIGWLIIHFRTLGETMSALYEISRLNVYISCTCYNTTTSCLATQTSYSIGIFCSQF